jgi:hypothetical protein
MSGRSRALDPPRAAADVRNREALAGLRVTRKGLIRCVTIWEWQLE